MTIIVVTFNRVDYLRHCLSSLLGTTPDSDRILVVDNASFDDTPAYLNGLAAERDGRVRILRPGENLGCAGGRNFGFRQSERSDDGDDLVAFSDDDYYYQPGWRRVCREAFDHDPSIGLVTPHHDYRASTVTRRVGVVPRLIYLYRSLITTSACVIRKDVYRKVKGYTESGKVMGWISTDFCRRIRGAGYEIVSVVPLDGGGRLVHNMDHPKSRLNLRDKYRESGYEEFRQAAKAGKIRVGEDVGTYFNTEGEGK